MTQSTEAGTGMVPAVMIYESCVGLVNRLVDRCHKLLREVEDAKYIHGERYDAAKAAAPFKGNYYGLAKNASDLRKFLNQTDTQTLILLFKHMNPMLPDTFFDRLLEVLEKSPTISDSAQFDERDNKPLANCSSIPVKHSMKTLATGVLGIASIRDDLEHPVYVLPEPSISDKAEIHHFAQEVAPFGIAMQKVDQTPRITMVLVRSLNEISYACANMRNRQNWTWECVDPENDKWVRVGKDNEIRRIWRSLSEKFQKIIDLTGDQEQYEKLLAEIHNQCTSGPESIVKSIALPMTDAEADQVVTKIDDLVRLTKNYWEEFLSTGEKFEDEGFATLCSELLEYSDAFAEPFKDILNMFRETGFTPKLLSGMQNRTRPIEDVIRTL